MRFVFLILALGLGEARAAEVIPAAPSAYCNDYAGLLKPATVQSLNRALDQFERATSDQILVAIYPRLASDSSVEDYTVRVAQAWGVGQKVRSNGAVLFVFAQSHQLRIVTGYGLEPTLTDALSKRIIEDEIVPRFRAGDYDGGIVAGVRAMTAAVKGEYQGNGRTVDDGRARSSPYVIPILFVLVVGWSLIRSRRQVVYRGSGTRSVWGGGGPWIFPGGGGGGGGGGSSGGGFSGGGGGFGGGGAGGSW